MEKIASFQVDHLRLKPGLYVSRKDKFGSTILTTFDLRFKEPNKEPVIDVPALHTIEHLGATFLRSHKEWAPKTVYFGPMGCRTGCYVILEGDWDSQKVLPLIRELLDWIIAFEGDIPGAAPAECGNYSEQNLNIAKWEARRYAAVLKNPGKENLNYPD
ncbi:S-ribosylhomocysteinase LuxS [Treponema primitia ZAS-2]|uniref:S-ribosylhomocysteine lyase n=1 Tax=Treponema primitia (strain ATCC BAA-887 / DSM 12427 / ZAS-2) TaxID=545694 RepID=F5YLQ4_TREPZ|nr:S-ribosylhomocysteine lyase [Treponema primitia]AEF85079.1 S-ribosylhomocysteinase LuxS [Treponema primitia ZAS-2]